jgi:hypothetical protein
MEPLKSNQSTLFTWAHDLMPTCHDVTRLQSRALDETLPVRMRLGLRCHLLFCAWCRRYGRQLRFLRHALRHGGEHLAFGCFWTLNPEARKQIKERLKNTAR